MDANKNMQIGYQNISISLDLYSQELKYTEQNDCSLSQRKKKKNLNEKVPQFKRKKLRRITSKQQYEPGGISAWFARQRSKAG